MILGIGTDLIDIRRIERSAARFGERFLLRIYTERERALCAARRNPIPALAQRYAAKEACAKALGTGFRQGVRWKDIEVDRLPSGQPIMRLFGDAEARLRALAPPWAIPDLHVSLSDEPPYAHAVVIIYARGAAG